MNLKTALLLLSSTYLVACNSKSDKPTLHAYTRAYDDSVAAAKVPGYRDLQQSSGVESQTVACVEGDVTTTFNTSETPNTHDLTINVQRSRAEPLGYGLHTVYDTNYVSLDKGKTFYVHSIQKATEIDTLKTQFLWGSNTEMTKRWSSTHDYGYEIPLTAADSSNFFNISKEDMGFTKKQRHAVKPYPVLKEIYKKD